ncbi:DNA-binding protein [Microbacterium sp. CFBP9034]|uniref:DNA-binding protein n=1 Tax=Microbacterium sp. CFBP9034 TaxID=3096540 RepID=UPI002A6B3981|nr:DNA-binding protein [Microbacterium sp. CFBP9034]MDY0909288.1 DNA-binding protein [Microbacterium sp. CFBP9034]
MFVVTADQRGSRTSEDLVPAALGAVQRIAGPHLVLAPERTAGDEFQAAVSGAAAILDIVLHLTRLETWSVGVGIGGIEEPLPANVRAARGSAFLNARDAVEHAKRASTRVAVVGGADGGDAEALVRLLVELRDRRTVEGWEVRDILAEGLSQRDAAARLGITEGAVSLRVRNAALRVEEAAIPALERLLARADSGSGPAR